MHAAPARAARLSRCLHHAQHVLFTPELAQPTFWALHFLLIAFRSAHALPTSSPNTAISPKHSAGRRRQHHAAHLQSHCVSDSITDDLPLRTAASARPSRITSSPHALPSLPAALACPTPFFCHVPPPFVPSCVRLTGNRAAPGETSANGSSGERKGARVASQSDGHTPAWLLALSHPLC